MIAIRRIVPVWSVCLCLLAALVLMGCAAKHGEKADPPAAQLAEAKEAPASAAPVSVSPVSDAEFEDYDDDEAVTISDPLEGWNRFWFGFNDSMLLKIAKPIYTGYT